MGQIGAFRWICWKHDWQVWNIRIFYCRFNLVIISNYFSLIVDFSPISFEKFYLHRRTLVIRRFEVRKGCRRCSKIGSCLDLSLLMLSEHLVEEEGRQTGNALKYRLFLFELKDWNLERNSTLRTLNPCNNGFGIGLAVAEGVLKHYVVSKAQF